MKHEERSSAMSLSPFALRRCCSLFNHYLARHEGVHLASVGICPGFGELLFELPALFHGAGSKAAVVGRHGMDRGFIVSPFDLSAGLNLYNIRGKGHLVEKDHNGSRG